MKIAILSPNFPPESGACSLRIAYMAKALQAAGHEIEIITVLPNYPKGKIFEAYKNRFFVHETLAGISVRRYPIFASHSPIWFFRMINLLSIAFFTSFSLFFLRKWKPHYLIVQSPPFFLAMSGYFLAKFSNSRFVLNLSDLYPQVLADLGMLSKHSFLYVFLTKIECFLYKKSFFILCQTFEIEDWIRKILPQKQTLLYRTGTDTTQFEAKKEGFSNQNSPLRIVYAGLLGMAQGVLDLCQNVDFQAIGAELHLYGEGYERPLIEKYLSENPQKGIFLHPSLEPTQMPKHLSQFDAALVVQKAYLYGTVPAKIYEAVSVGLPILLLGEGESKQLLQTHDLGFLAKPQDYKTLINNILQLKNLPESERIAWAARNHAVAVAHFDRKTQAEKLLAWFEKLQGK